MSNSLRSLTSGSSSSGSGVSHSHANLAILDGIKIDNYGRIYYDAGSVSNSDIVSSSSLCLFGSLSDISGYGNHPSSTQGSSPSLSLGLDNQPALYFSGLANQELGINPFLANATGCTLYAVVSADSNAVIYRLVDTYNNESWWNYNNQGYFGVFLNSRLNYPSSMPGPGAGYHLISIHARVADYEVWIDKVSKGVRSLSTSQFNVGTRFLISRADRPFKGYLSLLCVVPRWLDPNGSEHQTKLGGIKSRFPSLPFV